MFWPVACPSDKVLGLTSSLLLLYNLVNLVLTVIKLVVACGTGWWCSRLQLANVEGSVDAR